MTNIQFETSSHRELRKEAVTASRNRKRVIVPEPHSKIVSLQEVRQATEKGDDA